jgi:hypothetical protein
MVGESLGIRLVQSLNHPLADQSSRRHVALLCDLAEPAQLGYGNPDRIDLGRVLGTLAPALARRWPDLAPVLGLRASFRFGGLTREHFPDAFAHRPSSYCLTSDGLASQAVAPHHRVCGGWSFGATMTVTTKAAMIE